MATTAFAQNTDVIKQRKEAFKSLIPHVKAGTAMMKGQAAFDLAKAKEIFSSYATIAKPLPDLFPEDSRTGEETRALPVIWEKKDDFNQRLVKFVNDATEASGSIDSEAAFKAAWPTVMGNCGACHKVYRAEKK
ncbi:MAG: cytochrome c [Pseudomonadota bacterium]